MKLRFIAVAFVGFFAFAGVAQATGDCPNNTTIDNYLAGHPLPVITLDTSSYGTTKIFLSGDISAISPPAGFLICDFTHAVGPVMGQSGGISSFTPAWNTGGNAYLQQTAGDIFALIFSSSSGSSGSHDTGVLFFMSDSNGFIFPVNYPPVLSNIKISSSNASSTLAKVGDTVTLTFTSDSLVQTPSVTIGIHNNASVATTTGNSFTASTTMQSGDTEGAISFAIQLTNLFGTGGPVTSTTTDNSLVTFDRTPPVLTVTSGPAGGSISSTTPTSFAFTLDDPQATSTCTFDGLATSTCTGSASQTLTDGLHSFSITAADAVGNTTSTTTLFTLDTTPPSLTITAGPAASTTITTSSVSFSFTTDASSTQCSYDNAATSTCSSPFATTSADGVHTFALSATDTAGNTTYLSRSFTIDTTPAPVASGNRGTNGPPVAQQPTPAPAPTPTPAPTTAPAPVAEPAPTPQAQPTPVIAPQHTNTAAPAAAPTQEQNIPEAIPAAPQTTDNDQAAAAATAGSTLPNFWLWTALGGFALVLGWGSKKLIR